MVNINVIVFFVPYPLRKHCLTSFSCSKVIFVVYKTLFRSHKHFRKFILFCLILIITIRHIYVEKKNGFIY